MLNNSFKLEIYEKTPPMNEMDNVGSFKKLGYLYFSSDSDNINFIMKKSREEIKKVPTLKEWTITFINVFNYETGLYEPIKVITKPFKAKIKKNI